MSWSLVRHSLRFVVSFSLSKGSKVSRVSKVSKYQGIKVSRYKSIKSTPTTKAEFCKERNLVLKATSYRGFKCRFLFFNRTKLMFAIPKVASKLQFKADFYNRMQNVFNNL